MPKRNITSVVVNDQRLKELLRKYPAPCVDAKDECADWVRSTLEEYRQSSIGPDAPSDIRFEARMRFWKNLEEYVPEMFHGIGTEVLYRVRAKYPRLRDHDVFDSSEVCSVLIKSQWRSFRRDILSDEMYKGYESIPYFIPGGNREYYPIVFAMMYCNAAMHMRTPMYLYAAESNEAIRIQCIVHSVWPIQEATFYARSLGGCTFANSHSRYTPLGIIGEGNADRNAHKAIMDIIKDYTGAADFPAEPLALISQKHHNGVIKSKLAEAASEWLLEDLAKIVAEYYVSYSSLEHWHFVSD